MCTIWHHIMTVLRCAEWVVAELTDLVLGLGDIPDDRPLMLDEIDREYYALLDEECEQ